MADQVVKSVGLQTLSSVDDARRMADDLVSSAIVSLRRPITIPRTEGVDLSDVEREIDRASSQRDATNKVIDTEQANYGSASESQQAAIQREGAAGADKAKADQARAQEEANLYKSYAELFGISLDPAADIAITARRMRDLRPGAEAKLKRVQEMQSVGFLDNPLEWLVNAVQLPAAIGDYNQEANLINSLQSTIDASIQTGQNAAVFAGKGIPTITTAQAKADAEKLKALADKNVAIAKENLAKNNVTFAVQKLSNDINIANQTENMSRIELANEGLKYQSMINAINLADTHAQRLLKAATLIEKLQETKGMDIVLENYDRTMGHPKGTTTRYIFEKFSEPQRQNMVAIGAGSIGAGPYEGAANWFKSRPGPGASKENTRLFGYILQEIEKLSSDTKINMIDKHLQPAVMNKELNKRLSETISTAATPGNIFYEMTPAAMLASGTIATDSKLGKILEPFTKQAGIVQTDIILQAINFEYKNPVEAGAVIADYYAKNMQLRNSVMNTSLIGIQLPKNYKFKTDLESANAFLGLKTRIPFDLTKPEEATKYIIFKRVSDIAHMQAPRGQ